MMAFWDKISYMVQLLAACLIFMAPARKRSNFVLRSGLSAGLLLILSYEINSVYDISQNGAMPFAYWAVYVAVCLGFIWICLEGSLIQALYCLIFACGTQHIAFDLYLIYYLLGGSDPVIIVLIYVSVYAVFYLFMAKKLPECGEFTFSRKALFPMTTIILVVLFFSVAEASADAGLGPFVWHRIIYRMIDGICCFYVQWVQMNQKERISLQRELDGIHAIFQQQKKQYEVTSETIEMINQKCHDLKHQIRALRETTDERDREEYFDEIENAIMIYDTALATGNRALDTVLMEKGLFCQNHGIQWSCMADGSKLDFMKLEDIYAIFGNALDNSIRAGLALSDQEKRIISVKIIAQNHLLVIQIQNYYDGELQFENDLPVTTKKNKKDHGYGMKSIRYTAEKYNGTITVRAENNIFMLQILIPERCEGGMEFL